AETCSFVRTPSPRRFLSVRLSLSERDSNIHQTTIPARAETSMIRAGLRGVKEWTGDAPLVCCRLKLCRCATLIATSRFSFSARAIARDPTYALAYTGLADSYSSLVFPIRLFQK